MENVGPMIQYGAFGVLAFGFLGVLRWMMGKFDIAIDKNTSAIWGLTMATLTLQQEFLIHDLTVTGINPSTGANQDERSRKAYEKYKDLDGKIEETKKAIEKALLNRR